MAAAAARHIWATPRDWEVHRHLITQLYIDEERPLKDVMVIMKMAHDFHATEKMYKLRIRAWGLSKNLTSRDVPEMLQETLTHGSEARKCRDEYKFGDYSTTASSIRRSYDNEPASQNGLPFIPARLITT
ncbi:Clr5 domain-containing protein [Xylariales sp. PMI_506]|nr:Clr5 domain-containing protein [Xylariales sp. PMI_506]